MDNLNDAIEIMILDENDTIESFYEDISKEIEKYKAK